MLFGLKAETNKDGVQSMTLTYERTFDAVVKESKLKFISNVRNNFHPDKNYDDYNHLPDDLTNQDALMMSIFDAEAIEARTMYFNVLLDNKLYDDNEVYQLVDGMKHHIDMAALPFCVDVYDKVCAAKNAKNRMYLLNEAEKELTE